MAAILPRDGLARFTSAITVTPSDLSAAIASRGDGARRAISFSWSREICRCRSARSARTPSRISASTLRRFARLLVVDTVAPPTVARPPLGTGYCPPEIGRGRGRRGRATIGRGASRREHGGEVGRLAAVTMGGSQWTVTPVGRPRRRGWAGPSAWWVAALRVAAL